MNILVTGGRGQLGQSLRKVSADYPDHRFVFTDLPEGDITDAARMRDLVAGNRAGAIINCAAYTAVDRAESEPELARRINALGPATLARVAGEYCIPLLHLSTDYVFDGTATTPYREHDPTGPTGVYGCTKFEGEQNIQAAGIDAVIVRTSWLYSEFGNNFVKTMLRLAAEREEIDVVSDQRGTPTYAPDLARALMELIIRGIKGTSIYHFSNLGEISWWDFAIEIFRRAGKEVKVNPIPTSAYPTAARRPLYSVLDKGKISALGIEVPSWRESLEVCIAELENKL